MYEYIQLLEIMDRTQFLSCLEYETNNKFDDINILFSVDELLYIKLHYNNMHKILKKYVNLCR